MKREIALKILNDIKNSYDLIAEDFSRTRKFVWKEFGSLAGYAENGDKILDLGCGNGRFVELFKNKGVKYIGIDVSEKLIEIARKKYPEEKFQVFDGLKIPSEDNYFDKIFCIAVLHHIPGEELRRQFLEEARRVLKPGGKIILSAWYLWRHSAYWNLLLKFTWRKLIGKSQLDFLDILKPWGKISERYFHNFRKGELKNLIKKIGFKIEKMGIIERGKNNKNLLIVGNKPDTNYK